MKLPAGTEGGVIINPQKEGMLQYLMAFKGVIMIDSAGEKGLFLRVMVTWLPLTLKTKTVFTGGHLPSRT